MAQKIGYFFSSLILFILSNNSVSAQTNRNLTDTTLQINAITTAVPFLLITPDSRAGGMGETGVASTADINSMHWNASKLAFIEKKSGVSVSYIPWLRQLVDDINLSYLTGFYKVGKDQTIGASLRYFSLGNITFTDINGAVIRDYKPNEFALDVAYARKLADRFSGGLTLRYVFSNLTGGLNVGGANTKPGQAVAADISAMYQNTDLEVNGNPGRLGVGLNISNIGSKMSYTQTLRKDFIPTNLRLGTSYSMNIDQYNSISLLLDFNKLLVPTPPVYKTDASGQLVVDANGNKVIEFGKDPNRPIASGILGSFNDAPGGGKEELREVMYNVGFEYWYEKLFAFRAGYFHENVTKGNRQTFSVGFGIHYNVFTFDGSYLIPTNRQNSPLNNTFRFTLGFSFDGDDGKKKVN